MEIVKNMRVLNSLQKAGLIKFCEQTGEIITTLYSNAKHKCYYIDEAVGSSSFEYRGKKYAVKYFDGCFNPFVVKYNNPKELTEQKIVLGL